MDYCKLSDLILALEQGTHIHICVAFLNDNGNRKTKCHYNQSIHNSPVCKEAKKLNNGLKECYRCRRIVQKYVVTSHRPLSGLCTNGIYEYCYPVIYDEKVIAVIYIGNIYLGTQEQITKLCCNDMALLDTMEHNFTVSDCRRIAKILESYIVTLMEHYGNENTSFDPLIENIKNYLRENLVYGISVSDLANTFGYNEKYIGRLFKNRAGCSIKEFCNSLRVTQAKELLTDTDLSICQIANQLGFRNTAYFDRVFLKKVKVSPRVYREAMYKKRDNIMK